MTSLVIASRKIVNNKKQVSILLVDSVFLFNCFSCLANDDDTYQRERRGQTLVTT